MLTRIISVREVTEKGKQTKVSRVWMQNVNSFIEIDTPSSRIHRCTGRYR
jgi:hypothetical protein